MVTLADASTPTPQEGGYAYEVPAGWRQGRGAFGGLTIGTLIRSIEHRVADPKRRVRSVTAELPGPTLGGRSTIEVDILRAGNSMTTGRALLRQADGVKSHAVAVLAARRAGAGPLAWRELTPPDAPSWRTLEPMVMAAGLFSEFAQHFEYRIVGGIPTPKAGAPARAIR